MKRTIMTVVALAAMLLPGQPAAAEDLASAVVGTWKLTSFARKELATGSTMRPFGESPAGHLVYAKGGTSAYVIAADKRPAPGPNPARRSGSNSTGLSWQQAANTASKRTAD